MLKTIKARYERGHIQPFEPLSIADGAEVEVTITVPKAPLQSGDQDPTAATSGAWKDLLDCEAFEDQVSRNRSLITRPGVVL